MNPWTDDGRRTYLLHSLMPACLLLVLAAGCSPPSILLTPVSGQRDLVESTVRPGRGWAQPKIAVIEVEGMLLNRRAPGLLGAGENPLSLLAEQLARAEADPAVKAVVIRVNSPGGGVTTSETMYELIQRFGRRSGKPVVASAQDVAASGGYYVCLAADRIVAHPTSIVGSIGVIFTSFDASGTMALIGLRSTAIKSGELKDMASPLKPLDPRAAAVMQQMVDEYFGRFSGAVRTARKLSDAQLAAATDGRVFSGQTALAMGLIDELGLLDDAIAAAEKLAHVEHSRVIVYRRPHGHAGSVYAYGGEPAAPERWTAEVAGHAGLLPAGFYYLWRP